MRLNFFTDRVFRLPRLWSNSELRQHAHLFHGDVVNVSGWKDIDKEGGHYRDYFVNASSYTITNYKAEARGLQGLENELFLDLEAPLSAELNGRFDVVFNHTTLEHIFDVQTAFANLCALSRDVVILVVPFLQQYHAAYGDYWRFTPLLLQQLFEQHGFSMLYQSFTPHPRASVYLYAIASRQPEKWSDQFTYTFTVTDPRGQGSEPFVGSRAIDNWPYRLRTLLRRIIRR